MVAASEANMDCSCLKSLKRACGVSERRSVLPSDRLTSNILCGRREAIGRKLWTVMWLGTIPLRAACTDCSDGCRHMVKVLKRRCSKKSKKMWTKQVLLEGSRRGTTVKGQSYISWLQQHCGQSDLLREQQLGEYMEPAYLYTPCDMWRCT